MMWYYIMKYMRDSAGRLVVDRRADDAASLCTG